MYFVYIIKSLNVLRYYIGSTENIDRRLSDHNSGKVNATKAYKPWELVYTEEYSSEDKAIKREKYFKSAAGRRLIKKILRK